MCGVLLHSKNKQDSMFLHLVPVVGVKYVVYVVRTRPHPVCTCFKDGVDWAASANINSCK